MNFNPGQFPTYKSLFPVLINQTTCNYTGKNIDIIYSVLTFFGVVFLFLVASRIIVTKERIRIFLQINMVLIVYSTIASLNKYLKLITFDSPMLPIYGSDKTGYFEGGGIIGCSPLYGEHSMILAILFATFLIIGYNLYKIKKSYLIFFLMLSIINIFMSISRSVFMLAIFGIILILLFQVKLSPAKVHKIVFQLIMILVIGGGTLSIIKYSGLDYVFERVEEINENNQSSGGISLSKIINGSAFNRDVAFDEGYRKYYSKESWWIGYGWGLPQNNRDAFFKDPTIQRISAHSQIFAILFIFGWIGFIAYFGLILRLIWKSYQLIGNSRLNLNNRITAIFFMIAFMLFILNEIKVDSIYYQHYFAATMLLLGMAYANVNTTNFKINN